MRNKREYRRRAVVLILAVAGLFICAAPSSTSSGLASAQAAAPSWSFTGSLNTPRSGHTATLLPNGKVLVAGGTLSCPPPRCSITNTAELYDPATGTWSFTGSLNVPRTYLSATLLPNGKVLVVGGSDARSDVFAEGTAELYDPATGSWSMTGSPHFTHWGGGIATLLADGRVLISGGLFEERNFIGDSDKAEIYDPATNTWSITGSLHEARHSHTATLLQNGKVLVAGGSDLRNVIGSGFEGTVLTNELYDPNTGTWSVTGNLNLTRGGHTATLLPGGFVLVAGGVHHDEVSASAELYDPTTGAWNDTGSLISRRAGHTATLLPNNGRVLVAGGFGDEFAPGSSAEVYDPATGGWSATAGLNTARVGHTATLLSNGKVLVVGGVEGVNISLQTAEVYDPGPSSSSNPIDDPPFFVRQHYLDFLGREPDEAGLTFWTNEITSCGADAGCVEAKRVNVSAAFFLSIEFQETGYLVHRLYKVAYNDLPGKPVPLRREEFVPDAQAVAQGVEVGVGDWRQRLEANKTAFVNGFTGRPRFTAAFPSGMSAAVFVDTLNANAGFALSLAERDGLVGELASGAKTRAQVLRAVAEDADLAAGPEKNRAFVLAQYFGYLRRNPDDIGFDGQPDSNFEGYTFWLNKLTAFNGDFVRAEMVRAFISSIEYRRRFSQD